MSTTAPASLDRPTTSEAGPPSPPTSRPATAYHPPAVEQPRSASAQLVAQTARLAPSPLHMASAPFGTPPLMGFHPTRNFLPSAAAAGSGFRPTMTHFANNALSAYALPPPTHFSPLTYQAQVRGGNTSAPASASATPTAAMSPHLVHANQNVNLWQCPQCTAAFPVAPAEEQAVLAQGRKCPACRHQQLYNVASQKRGGRRLFFGSCCKVDQLKM